MYMFIAFYFFYTYYIIHIILECYLNSGVIILLPIFMNKLKESVGAAQHLYYIYDKIRKCIFNKRTFKQLRNNAQHFFKLFVFSMLYDKLY